MNTEPPIQVGDTVEPIPSYFMPGFHGKRKVLVTHEGWLIVEGYGGYIPARKFRRVNESKAAAPSSAH